MKRKTFWKAAALTALLLAPSVGAQQSDRAGGTAAPPRAHPSTGGDKLANVAAALGFHFTPGGELIVDAAEHDDDGPGGTVAMLSELLTQLVSSLSDV